MLICFAYLYHITDFVSKILLSTIFKICKIFDMVSIINKSLENKIINIVYLYLKII